MYKILFSISVIIFLSGCYTSAEQPHFKRVFCWGTPYNEDAARKFSEIGVTDIMVHNQAQYDLAVKYKMTPYCGVFLPQGPYLQVMTKEETEYHNYINGYDLNRKNYTNNEFQKILNQRRIEKNHRFGGEYENAIDTLNYIGIQCFNSDEDYKLSKSRIDSILKKAPAGVKGIYFDFLGYTNHYGCYCKVCLQDYQKFLQAKNLKDSENNRNIFYRDILVKYYNAMTDYVKSKRPDFKVLAHIYPVFTPEVLYGCRTNVDFCGQTVAWYFPWELAKVAKYTDIVLKSAKKYYPHSEGIPFVGLNAAHGSALVNKSPEVLEKELQTILGAGGRTLLVCNGADMIKNNYYEIFKKYCSEK